MLDTVIARRLRDLEVEYAKQGEELSQPEYNRMKVVFYAEYVRALKTQLAMARGTLAFYADDDLYEEEPHYHQPILDDAGKQARVTLTQMDERQHKFLQGEVLT